MSQSVRKAYANVVPLNGDNADPNLLAPAETCGGNTVEPLPQRVLIVEDVLPERVRLKAMLHQQGYRVDEAANGNEALRILSSERIDLVISDWCMPEMDGLTLLKQLTTRFNPPPYFILLTGQDAMCDLVAAMDAGADDFIRKPFNREELRTRLQAGARIVTLRQQLQNQNEQLFLALQREFRLNRTMQQDLKAAAQLQRTTLPADRLDIPGLKVAHHFLPAAGVAGDTYNVLPLGDHQVAFYHIDAAGHGVRAALLSFALSRYLGDPTSRAIALTENTHDGQLQAYSPARVVAELNHKFLDQDHCRNYFTMVYGILDLTSGRGQLCQAGHPHPLQISQDGTTQRLGDGGLPVGVLVDAEYQDVAFELAEGDKLLLCSDGLFSCPMPAEKTLDDRLLLHLLKRRSEQPVEILNRYLAQLVDRLQGTAPLEDDVSFLWLQRRAESSLTNGSHTACFNSTV